jgi:cytoskeletal protein RodZ
MSHDSHHGHTKENKTIISFKSSFWLILIIVGLFVAALNFIQAESGKEEGEKAKTEEHHGAEGKEAVEASKEAEKKAETPAAKEATTDTAHKAEH